MLKELLIAFTTVFIIFAAFKFGEVYGIKQSTSFYRQCIDNGANGFYVIDNEINCIYE